MVEGKKMMKEHGKKHVRYEKDGSKVVKAKEAGAWDAMRWWTG